MKMMPPDVISHENQLQYLSEPSIFMLDVFRTADHAGQIFIPHRLKQYNKSKPPKWVYKIWVLSGKSGFAYDKEGDENHVLIEKRDCGTSSNDVSTWPGLFHLL